jgi:hypothetical protein
VHRNYKNENVFNQQRLRNITKAHRKLPLTKPFIYFYFAADQLVSCLTVNKPASVASRKHSCIINDAMMKNQEREE